MSQVIVHNKDPKFRQEEQAIDTESCVRGWRKSDVTKTLLIEKIIALLVAPIMIIWAMLFACMSVGILLCLGALKFFSLFFSRK